MIRGELYLCDFQRFALDTYKAFDYLIQQGKQYPTLQIYKDYFQNTGKYSGLVIFNSLLQCVRNMLKEISVPEIE